MRPWDLAMRFRTSQCKGDNHLLKCVSAHKDGVKYLFICNFLLKFQGYEGNWRKPRYYHGFLKRCLVKRVLCWNEIKDEVKCIVDLIMFTEIVERGIEVLNFRINRARQCHQLSTRIPFPISRNIISMVLLSKSKDSPQSVIRFKLTIQS